MKTAAIILLAICTFGVYGKPSPLGVLDGIVEKVLNDLRPQLASLVLPNVDSKINASGINVHITTENITTSRLDNFTIVELKTTLLPIKLNILTLNWEEVTLSGLYGLDGVIDIDQLQGPVTIDGHGNALVVLKNVTFNVGATFSSADGHLQIREVTLLSATLSETIVELENIFDDADMDLVINTFLGFFVTELVEDQGDAILKAIEPTLVEEINKKLMEIDFP